MANAPRRRGVSPARDSDTSDCAGWTAEINPPLERVLSVETFAASEDENADVGTSDRQLMPAISVFDDHPRPGTEAISPSSSPVRFAAHRTVDDAGDDAAGGGVAGSELFKPEGAPTVAATAVATTAVPPATTAVVTTAVPTTTTAVVTTAVPTATAAAAERAGGGIVRGGNGGLGLATFGSLGRQGSDPGGASGARRTLERLESRARMPGLGVHVPDGALNESGMPGLGHGLGDGLGYGLGDGLGDGLGGDAAPVSPTDAQPPADGQRALATQAATYSTLPFLLLLGIKCLEEHLTALGLFVALLFWRGALDRRLTDAIAAGGADRQASTLGVALLGLGSVAAMAWWIDFDGTGRRLLLQFPGSNYASNLSGVSGGVPDSDALRLTWVLGTALRMDLVAQVLCIGAKAAVWLLLPGAATAGSGGGGGGGVVRCLRSLQQAAAASVLCWGTHACASNGSHRSDSDGDDGGRASPREHGAAPVRSWAGALGLARRLGGWAWLGLRRGAGSLQASADRVLRRGSFAVSSFIAPPTPALGPQPSPRQGAGGVSRQASFTLGGHGHGFNDDAFQLSPASAGAVPLGLPLGAVTRPPATRPAPAAAAGGASYMELRRRRRCLAIVEAGVLAYRLMLPVPLWCRYYSGAGQPWGLDSSSTTAAPHHSFYLEGPTQYAHLMVGVYLTLKTLSVVGHLKLFGQALSSVVRDVPAVRDLLSGRPLPMSELQGVGGLLAIVCAAAVGSGATSTATAANTTSSSSSSGPRAASNQPSNQPSTVGAAGLRRASGGELAEAGGSDCSICFDPLSRPVSLDPCGHLFCEDCACEWLDRERSCPLCRASVLLADEPDRELFKSLNANTGATSVLPLIL